MSSRTRVVAEVLRDVPVSRRTFPPTTPLPRHQGPGDWTPGGRRRRPGLDPAAPSTATTTRSGRGPQGHRQDRVSRVSRERLRLGPDGQWISPTSTRGCGGLGRGRPSRHTGTATATRGCQRQRGRRSGGGCRRCPTPRCTRCTRRPSPSRTTTTSPTTCSSVEGKAVASPQLLRLVYSSRLLHCLSYTFVAERCRGDSASCLLCSSAYYYGSILTIDMISTLPLH